MDKGKDKAPKKDVAEKIAKTATNEAERHKAGKQENKKPAGKTK